MESSSSSTRVSSFVGALDSLTGIKIRELANQRNLYEREVTKLLSELESKETYREKLGLLMDTLDEGGLRYCSKPAAGIDNTRFMVDGGPWDTTLTDAIFKERFEAAMEGVKQGMNRARYAELYGAVIKEWLENEGADLSNDKNTDGEGSTANDRPDKLKQRNILEGYMWRGEGVKSDLAKFKELLEETFGDPKDEEVDIIMAEAEDAAIGQIEGDEYEDIIATFEGRETTQEKRLLAEKKITQKRKMAAFLQLVRKNMKEYCKTIFHKTITTRDVSSAIDACLSYDSLTPSQQVAAREIRQSSTLLEEIASVMTLTLRDLGHWEWPGEGVNLYMRRHLNGKHRCFFEQDVITIIFLQYIGVSFGAKLKSELINVVFNGWDWGVPLLSKGEVKRRTEMFHETPEQFFRKRMEASNSYIAKESILGQRITDFQENYVASALPNEGEAAYGDTTKEGPVPRVMRLKQGVLRRLLADIQYIQHTQPDASVTVATADAFNFAPSVSHEIALEAMRFLGITEYWLYFFAKVISPPAKFEDQETAQKIQRGTPTSQALGYTMGEAILFVMDVAINQRAPGLKWYRQHDDVWFWDTDKAKVNTAWRFMEQFARISGFQWNKQKSGSCRVCSKYDIESGRVTSDNRYPGSEILPQGNVQWGLLVLDSTGRCSINQVMVNWHTQELKERFQKPHSILQFIRAYSRYMNFFTRNCAQTAIIFSRSHVENLLTTLQGIHYTLFPSHSGNFLHFISSILRARFPHLLPADDPQPIPESWLILPLIYGGLGCPVPMLETFALLRAFRENESAKSNPYTPSPTYDLTSERGNFESCLSADRTLYAAYKQQWQERSSYPSNRDLFPLEYGASHKPSFMSFDEYNRGRESQSMYWSATYTHLLSPANPARPDSSSTATARYANWLLQFPRCHDAPFSKTVDGEDEPWRKEWDELESPWDWWFALYAEQQGKMFGGMRVLSPQLMLGGMVRRIGQRAVKFDI